ncbi:phosphate ABC transporter substrate-binding protein PstS [Cupriavidus sp. USMAA2-4]|uniref:phosphate ABC transporter substrate-binding protein PstS n=1 Tax=Cupriavidus sp. USMAA2-4 TaxID=876364 RepID=UPI000A01824C|nr:phosphate ABC transporter substrate-binding protein PstS [Cupriavidus sp. USMAA2-4]
MDRSDLSGAARRWLPGLIRRSLLSLACLLSLAFLLPAAHGSEITGAGSTFVYPVLAKWAASYYSKTGKAVDYQPIGSGGGIQQVKAGSVTFGATDMPLRPEELHSAGLAQFPLVVGGVVPVVNLDGIQPGQLHLTGPLLARIYLGTISNWNDPAIAADNPGLVLPDRKIVVVHRSDLSGTTFNWTDYLSKVSDGWQRQVGAGTTVRWPVGFGASGSDGVSLYIRNVKGAIGYVELTYALQRKLAYAAVRNQAGVFVQPTWDSFSAAVASAQWTPQQDFYQVITNASGDKAWPITGVVYVLMQRRGKSAGDARDALAFFRWVLQEGQADADREHYVALPEPLVRQVEGYWSEAFR